MKLLSHPKRVFDLLKIKWELIIKNSELQIQCSPNCFSSQPGFYLMFYSFPFCRQSYELKPNCPVIAFKCANGLMRLPQKHQDVKLIKKIISDCKKKFPNSGFGNLVCAMYHERIDKVRIFIFSLPLIRFPDFNTMIFLFRKLIWLNVAWRSVSS